MAEPARLGIAGRQRASNRLEISPAANTAEAVPIPKANMITNARPVCCPRDARAMAAPRVGPTQGSQTNPSNAPTPNCPAGVVAAA